MELNRITKPACYAVKFVLELRPELNQCWQNTTAFELVIWKLGVVIFSRRIITKNKVWNAISLIKTVIHDLHKFFNCERIVIALNRLNLNLVTFASIIVVKLSPQIKRFASIPCATQLRFKLVSCFIEFRLSACSNDRDWCRNCTILEISLFKLCE